MKENLTFDNIIVEKKYPIVKLIINRPRILNALDSKTRQEMILAIKDINKDPKARVLIVTGAGERAFSAGQDIKESESFEVKDIKKWIGEFHSLYEHLLNLDIPTIASINGYALGGALQVALACDLRISSENGKLGMPEINVGIPCITGGFLLSTLIDFSRVVDLILTGRIVDAKKAEEFGLVHRVVPTDELEKITLQIAQELAGKSPVAIRLNKKWFRELKRDFSILGKKATAYHEEAYASGDPEKFMRAFLKRKKS